MSLSHFLVSGKIYRKHILCLGVKTLLSCNFFHEIYCIHRRSPTTQEAFPGIDGTADFAVIAPVDASKPPRSGRQQDRMRPSEGDWNL